MRSLAIVSAALVAAALVHAPAAAQSDRDNVRRQLDAVTQQQASTRGFGPATGVMDGNTIIGMLPAGDRVTLEINLRAGVEYFIPAGCDTDCSDLDTRIHTPDGQTVLDEDVEEDDVPMLSFTARSTGPHLLTVMMPGCSTELCYFGFRVLQKR